MSITTPMLASFALPVIPFPAIDPVMFEIGPIALRWYGLSYVAGILLGWRYALRLSRHATAAFDSRQIDDFIVWAAIGTIIGGRLGSVLFYNLPYYTANPVEALKIWQGGMSFHGGMLGVTAAMVLFARRHRIPVLGVSDIVAAAVPIGLFFGRMANFINGELYGRVTDVPWAMVFPNGGPEPRHPSQLYQATLEGLVLFAVLAILAYRGAALARRGMLTGTFLAGYAIARMVGELFRQPDANIGFLVAGTTMGQLLSLPMLIAGVGLILWSRRPA